MPTLTGALTLKMIDIVCFVGLLYHMVLLLLTVMCLPVTSSPR